MLGVLLGAVIFLWFKKHPKEIKHSQAELPKATATPQPKPSAAVQVNHAAEIKQEMAFWQAAFLTPITFYGKVVDEKGNPVAGAKTIIQPTDCMNGASKNFEKITDNNGNFSISDLHGLSVAIAVSKGGYYSTPQSRGSFGYIQSSYGTFSPHIDPNKPAIFVLQRMGQTEPLIKHEWFQAEIAKDGTPTYLDLITGKKTQGADSMQIQIWTQDAGLPPNGWHPYPWKAMLTISGGGVIVKIGGPYDFTAPTEGYTQDDVINMQSNDPKWRTHITKEYYFKFSNGKYARARIQYCIGRFQFVSVTSYLNPQPGHTNLEYDPAQQVKTP